MYDWANSAFQTTIVAAVFPIYFHKVAAAGLPPAEATSRFAWATTIAILIVAIVAPLLGAIADYAAVKKKLLAVFLGDRRRRDRRDVLDRARRLAVRARAVRHRQRRRRRQHRVLRVAAAAPGRARRARSRVVGRLCASATSAAACCWPINLLMIQQAGAVRHAGRGRRRRALSLASVGVWWLVFSIPLFRSVPEPPGRVEAGERPRRQRARRPARGGWSRRFRELRRYRQAFLLLLAFLLYNDGIQTIIRMATTYGAEMASTRTR